MQARQWVRRCIVVAMSALVAATGMMVQADAAHAAKSSKKKSTATVAIMGSVSNPASCEGKLSVDIRYTEYDGRTKLSNQPIDVHGNFVLYVNKVNKGQFEVTANVIGHPTHRTLYFDDQTVQVRRDRDQDIELGRMRVPACPPSGT